MTTTESTPPRKLAVSLFALSLVALFLELMLIRWVPAVVKIVAYYANLMLISSFLGLGLGALLSRKGWDLFRWFPPLLLVATGFFLACRTVVLPASESELRFFAVPPQWLNCLVLVGIFLLNAVVFIAATSEPASASVMATTGSSRGTLSLDARSRGCSRSSCQRSAAGHTTRFPCRVQTISVGDSRAAQANRMRPTS